MKFLLGFVIGLAGALLFAPAPGEETRRALKQRVRELKRLPRRKAEEAAQVAKERAGEMGATIGRKAAESAVEAVEGGLLDKDRTA